MTAPDDPPADALPAAAIDDATLTRQGLAPRGQGRLLVLACGALAREILAIVKAAGLGHVDLACLPAILHNHPERIVPRLRAEIARHRPRYARIFVAYADCGTGGQLAALCREMGVEMLEGPHCYSFYEGTEAFAARAEQDLTAFYLTDFLVRQFDAFVWKPLGLDRHPELRDSYFGHYTKLVHQAQTPDPALKALARSHADRLGLAFEYRLTGFGELETALIQQARRA